MTGMAWAGRLGIVIAIIIIEKASPALAWLLVILALVGTICIYLYAGQYLPRPVLRLVDKATGKRPPEPAKAPEPIDATELSGFLKSRVVGQDAVVDAVATRLRQRLAARRKDKPVAVMCFAGAPGVGKTLLAKRLAEKLYGSSDHLHFFDMTQMQQAYAAHTLFGVPAGHMGSDQPGALSRALLDKPNSIVLLDEFEKAHRDVHTKFLTAWNDGFVTDASNGARFSTVETIFILTTNAGAQRIAEMARSAELSPQELDELARGALTDAQFAPEVLSRIDDVFTFRELEGLDVARVVALEIEAKTREYELEVAPQGIDPQILLDAIKTFSDHKPKGGVREIARRIEQRIANGLIEAQLAKVRRVRLEKVDERIKVIPVPDEEPRHEPAAAQAASGEKTAAPAERQAAAAG